MNERDQCLIQGSSVPYRTYPGISVQQAQAHYLHRLASTTGKIVGDSTTRMATVFPLAWDSSILNLRCGRADLVSAVDHENAKRLAHEIVAEAESQGINHLSVRFDAEDTHLVRGFLSAGFEQVDSIQTYVIQNPEGERDIEGIRLATLEDASQVREIARTAFSVDRFHSDPFIEPVLADELHAQWGENSVLGKAADAVVVAHEGDRILGFVTCKVQPGSQDILGSKIGTIILVATDNQARGKGLATKMLRFALAWFAKQGCRLVDVGTQASNIAAARLYEGSGFDLRTLSVSLRRGVLIPTEPTDMR